jgi:putative ABC transport system permease protein
MPLIFKLSFRNLFHDPLRLVATMVGIVFSIVLVTVQMGLYFGFGRVVSNMIDHAAADLWIVPKGTKCFEDPSLLDDTKRLRARAVDGVAEASPLVTGFSDWRMASGNSTPVFVVGSDLHAKALTPWDVVDGSVDALAVPNAVAVDRSYLDRLGITGLDATAQIRGQHARVTVLTGGIRSFTTTPYVFTALDRARLYTGIPSSQETFILVRLAPGADREAVRHRLQDAVPGVEVLTSAEFRDRSRAFWLFGTGAGAALFAGALLGVIVGTVIVAQTLYSSTKEHLSEFATLRAIGSSKRYIYTVIVCQALISAVVGFCCAGVIDAGVMALTRNTALPIVVTEGLMLLMFGLTVVMCIASSSAAIFKVTRLDPATVFVR